MFNGTPQRQESSEIKIIKAKQALADSKQTLNRMKEVLFQYGLHPDNREAFAKNFNLTPEQQIRFIKELEHWCEQLKDIVNAGGSPAELISSNPGKKTNDTYEQALDLKISQFSSFFKHVNFTILYVSKLTHLHK